MADAPLLTIWPLYLVGTIIVFVGFIALHAWIRGLTGRGPDQPPSILATSVVAFLLGATTIAVAIQIDQMQTTALNTRTLVYRVEVGINGNAPVRLLLPAPGEPGFFGALNVTNGTSSLRLQRVGADPYVELLATADVSFAVRTQVVTSAFNDTLVHIRPNPAAAMGRGANATIEMVADGTGTTTAALALQIQILEACRFTTFELEALILEGAREYAGTMNVAVC